MRNVDRTKRERDLFKNLSTCVVIEISRSGASCLTPRPVAAKHDKDSAISLIRTTLKGWHCLRYTQSTNAELRYPKPQTPRKGVIHNQQLDAVTTKEER
jgi:hypothetical protein